MLQRLNWSMSRFFQFLVKRGCIDVASGYWWRSEQCSGSWTKVLWHDLVCRKATVRCFIWKCRWFFVYAESGLLLGDAGTGAASLACCCIVVSWYLQRGLVRRPEVIFSRLSEIALKRTGNEFRKLALKSTIRKSCCYQLESGIGSALSAAVIGWIPCQQLAAGRGANLSPLGTYAPPQAIWSVAAAFIHRSYLPNPSARAGYNTR